MPTHLSALLRTALAAVVALSLVACSKEWPDGADGPDEGPTFHRDVEPILQRSCQGCHAPDGIAPISLVTYEEARTVAALVADRTTARTMPPWGAVETEDCTPRHSLRNDIRLTDEEIDLIADWNTAGAPEGDPDDAPPPIELGPRELDGVELELTPAKPFVTSGTTDQFRCFPMDPGFTELTYVNGTFVVPSNRAVAHHAVVFTDPQRASLDLVDADGGYDCFGGAQVPGAQLLAVWTPGQEPFELPANIGMPVAAGSLLVVQMHYHPLGPPADPDLTRVQLRFNDAKPDYFLAPSTPIGNFLETMPTGDGLVTGPEFKVPANVADHVEQMQLTLPAITAGGDPLPEIWVYGAAAHMHYVGVDETIHVERANPVPSEPTRECLLHDRWSFDWQRIYEYDAPLDDLPLLRPGDKIQIRCLYDNTLQNPGVQRALADEGLQMPVDVFLGEETTEEMCLALLPLLVRAP
jgi:hypothetical protein